MVHLGGGGGGTQGSFFMCTHPMTSFNKVASAALHGFEMHIVSLGSVVVHNSGYWTFYV